MFGELLQVCRMGCLPLKVEIGESYTGTPNEQRIWSPELTDLWGFRAASRLSYCSNRREIVLPPVSASQLLWTLPHVGLLCTKRDSPCYWGADYPKTIVFPLEPLLKYQGTGYTNMHIKVSPWYPVREPCDRLHRQTILGTTNTCTHWGHIGMLSVKHGLIDTVL